MPGDAGGLPLPSAPSTGLTMKQRLAALLAALLFLPAAAEWMIENQTDDFDVPQPGKLNLIGYASSNKSFPGSCLFIFSVVDGENDVSGVVCEYLNLVVTPGSRHYVQFRCVGSNDSEVFKRNYFTFEEGKNVALGGTAGGIMVDWMRECISAGGAEMQFVLDYFHRGKARFDVPLGGFLEKHAEAVERSGG